MNQTGGAQVVLDDALCWASWLVMDKPLFIATKLGVAAEDPLEHRRRFSIAKLIQRPGEAERIREIDSDC